MQQSLQINKIDVTQINLQPGEALAITIKSDYVTPEALQAIKEQFQDLFPNNAVFVFGMGENDDMRFNVIKENKEIGCGTQSYCVDCNCGKKEQYEGENNG